MRPPLPAVLFVLLLCLGPVLFAAELRPFVLPSSQGQQLQPAMPSKNTDRSVYAEFENHVRSLDDAERSKLQQAYQQLLNQAERRGEQAQVDYYTNLIDILKDL